MGMEGSRRKQHREGVQHCGQRLSVRRGGAAGGGNDVVSSPHTNKHLLYVRSILSDTW